MQSERQVILVDIESILSALNLDLTNPEVKRGAIEAIEAILDSRNVSSDGSAGAGGGGGGEHDVEIDPDLLQPSIKTNPQAGSDDIEINDEDDILKDVKHNDSDEQPQSPMSNDTETGDADDESTNQEGDTDEPSDNANSDTTDASNTSEGDQEADSQDDGSSADIPDENTETDSDYTDDTPENDDESDTSAEAEDDVDKETAAGGDDENASDSDADIDDDIEEVSDAEEETESSEDEFEIDEDELLDDTLKEPFEDQNIKSKHEARKIKRERTLQAAKKALADAQSKNKAPALIRELENAIEALESLQEAIAKNIKDISDEEFNMLVNRVFDAIDALGDSGITYTSDEERQIKAQEIKADLGNKQTQADLSAEDVAQIRAETQAIKAREKEKAKYAPKSRGSFKGFQDFLSSLYRAIALQVQIEDTRDDTWSAISRRNSGNGVLQQGKKINDLPNKKIPIIDFYFDQSGSWGPEDIKVGNKAVESLMELEEKGQIKINLYYFGNYVSTDPNQTGKGTGGWNEIVKNVIATQATNVIIMTDEDMENWWEPSDQPPLRYTVPGYVWYLWRYGANAPRLPQDLKGRGGTQQFSFNHGDV